MSQLGGVDTHQTLRLSYQPMWQQPSGMWMNICGKPWIGGLSGIVMYAAIRAQTVYRGLSVNSLFVSKNALSC